MTTCQFERAMRAAISINSSRGVKSTSLFTKLKRTPRTPAACRRCSSASLTSRLTVATPRALPPDERSASTSARLSAPWQVACTMTLRAKPRWSRSAKSCALLASQGVYLRSGAKGNSAPGPKTWQCASTLPAGRRKRGRLGPSYQSSQPAVLVKSPVVGLLIVPPSVDVAQAGLVEAFAHLVVVQPQRAGGEDVALGAFVGLALARGLERLRCPRGGN